MTFNRIRAQILKVLGTGFLFLLVSLILIQINRSNREILKDGGHHSRGIAAVDGGIEIIEQIDPYLAKKIERNNTAQSCPEELKARLFRIEGRTFQAVSCIEDDTFLVSQFIERQTEVSLFDDPPQLVYFRVRFQ